MTATRTGTPRLWPSTLAAILLSVFTSACESDDRGEELEVTIAVAGDVVTIDASGSTVHVVRVSTLVEGGSFRSVWVISADEDGSPSQRRVGATIALPVQYGEVVDQVFTVIEPAALVQGTEYKVGVAKWGWAEECEAIGIDTEGYPDARCDLASGETLFTY
jgi:hypothetical protein